MGDNGFAAAGEIARTFVEARRHRRALAAYPGPVPQALDDAYAVQDAAVRLQGQRVGGWKLGRINPPLSDRYGANRLVGPIFAPSIVDEGDGRAAMPVYAGGFAAAEAEFLLRIGTVPDPARRDHGIADATALIDAVHCGIEIASSPYPRINEDGPVVTASDFGNNNGLVVGPAIDGWRDVDVNGWTVALAINGAVAGTGRGADMLDGPFGAAAFLFNWAATRGVALEAGQWISSGAVTGVHPVAIGDRIEARFDDGRIVVGCAITD